VSWLSWLSFGLVKACGLQEDEDWVLRGKFRLGLRPGGLMLRSIAVFAATKKGQPFASAKEDTQDTFFGEQPKKDN
jgi:hypothetical protein